MITEVSITNFKSIEGIRGLKLKPLTLFTGVNSSGKSNILAAISFFAEASRVGEIVGTNQVQLSNVYTQSDVRKYPYQELEKFIAYKGRKKKLVELEINIKPTSMLVRNISDSLTKELRQYIPELNDMTKIGSVGYTFSFNFESPQPLYFQRILINERVLMSVCQKATPHASIEDPKTLRGTGVAGSASSLFADQTFAPLSPEDAPIVQPLSKVARSILVYIRERVKMMYFVSGERGRIDPEVRVDAGGGFEPTWIGHNGQFLIEILSRCLTRQPEETKKIREWAKRFQLPEMRVGYIGRNTLEANFTDDSTGAKLNSALAGLGSRQILSVITQIFLAKRGSVIMIEEPEISLHPENQVLLHELFSEAISGGKQIICSTHSPFFVLALSKIIKKKQLTVDKIAVYHVTKDSKGTHIEPLKLNEHGFLATGVPSFMNVEKELFHDWSESLEEE
ncbi:ATP-binding protein [Candidatus Bathyarchaeota archaeon]|nr:ATP-binding protein [Candidatus Bathyarchaeota archaeon]